MNMLKMLSLLTDDLESYQPNIHVVLLLLSKLVPEEIIRVGDLTLSARGSTLDVRIWRL